jgi:putative membrane protein
MPDGYRQRFGPPGAWGWGFGLHALMMLAFWGLIISGLVLLGRGVSRTFGPGTASDEAFDTLRRRFAAGEISEEEYTRMRQVLQR